MLKTFKEEFPEELIPLLKTLWDYSVLNMPITKSDIIIGCGCKNLKIPIKCSELLKQQYADNILFTGGLGKITNQVFKKSEAEIFRDIAIENGASLENIFIENKSTNTGDNFRFSLEVIKENNLKYDKILIVHNNLSQRRTLATAKAIIPNKTLAITSPKVTFEEFINSLKVMDKQTIYSIISVAVGDIQRMIIFPQFGWMAEEVVPDDVIEAYMRLKYKGYDKYIFTRKEIENLAEVNGINGNMKVNYFN